MSALDLIKPTYDSIAASATDSTLKDALKLVSPEDIAALFEEDGVPEDSDIDTNALKDIIFEMARGRYHELDDNTNEDVAVESTDANGDGDTDSVKVDIDGDGEADVEAVNTDDTDESKALDDTDESKALDDIDAAADKEAEKNPISIDKVDAMADKAAEENPLSLDKVDAMADEQAHLDSTGHLDKDRLASKKSPEQQKLEDLINSQQKDILSALSDRLF